MLRGDAGRDRIFGGSNNDIIAGGFDEDTLFGGDGADELRGDVGDDWLFGGAGVDTLIGGTETDTFVFRSGSGGDVILDFNVSRDSLDLSATATDFTDIMDVQAAASETATGLLIDLGGGDSVHIDGLSLDDLESVDIIF